MHMIPEVFDSRVSAHKRTRRKGIMSDQFSDHTDGSDQSDQSMQSGSQAGQSEQTRQSKQSSSNPLNGKRPHRKPEEYSEVLRAEKQDETILNAFSPKPVNVHFDSQHKAEKILLLLRKHPLTQVPKVIGAVLFAIFPFLIGTLGLGSIIPPQFFFAAFVLWYLFLVGFLLEIFLTWFFHVFIITDERIIDVDFISLIYKRITAAKIDNIEDITTVTGGAVRSVFDFGTVKIQTAGARPEIAFEDVPQPSKVKRLLNELILEEEREKIEGRVN